jgi:outer membrane protein assembly factor BamB
VVRALDPLTGATVWTFETGGKLTGAAPTAHDGVLYLGTRGGHLIALTVDTGQLLWNVRVGDSVEGSPTLSDGLLFVSVIDPAHEGIKAVDPYSGQVVWATEGGNPSTPAAGDGQVFIVQSLYTQYAAAYSAATGHLRWYRDSGCGEACSAADTLAYSQGLVVADLDTVIMAFDADSGHVAWNVAASTMFAPPSMTGDTVYAADGYFMHSVDLATGHTNWQRSVGGEAFTPTPPIVANGVLYFAIDQQMHAFDADTGRPLWASPSEPSVLFGAPAVSDGMLYTASRDGTIYAYGLPASGEGH